MSHDARTFGNIRCETSSPGHRRRWTLFLPVVRSSIYDAPEYREAGVPLVVIAGKDTVPALRAIGRQKAADCSASGGHR